MQKKIFGVASFAGMLMLTTVAFAQSNAGVDPACLVKSADGTETVDKVKCPDGMRVGAGAETAPAPDTAAAPAAAPDATGSITPMQQSLTLSPEALSGGTVISANDFIGKRVYSRAGDDIGEVNDLIVTGNGGVQAVILGVGGFLGIGEKDVAISMASIDMAKDGEAVKLVVDGTKEQFTAAPAYDRATRTYMK
jgi:sporulation protein YlmC with PRC-barrel domain